VPNSESRQPVGKGALLRSAPRNRDRIVSGSLRVEVAEKLTNHGTYMQPIRSRKLRSLGGACVRLSFLWVTPDSDVTLSAEIVTNAGSSVAAVVVPGAWWMSARCFKRRRAGVWPQ
jgi:hypothetical protein